MYVIRLNGLLGKYEFKKGVTCSYYFRKIRISQGVLSMILDNEN